MTMILDRVYLAMDGAVEALKEACDCGCTDSAQEALVEAMRDLEAMIGLPSLDTDAP